MEKPREEVAVDRPPDVEVEIRANTPLQAPKNEVATEDVVSRNSQPEEEWKNSLYSRGVAEVVLGFVSVILGFLSLHTAAMNRYILRGSTLYENNHLEETYTGQGVWGGSFLLVCGIVAISAKINSTYAVYQANKVLGFLGIFVMLTVAIMSAVAAANVYPDIVSLKVIHGFISAIGFVSAALCVSHTSAVCCHMPESEQKLR